MDSDPGGDQGLEHRSSEDVSSEVLKSLGVLYWQVRLVSVAVR